MGRSLRIDVGGYVYHVLNRANAGAQLFLKRQDYQSFELILAEAIDRFNVRLFSYCIMPNHWHLVVQPQQDGDLARFMTWLTLTHVQRWHSQHGTAGRGHLYQGRYKSFLCEKDTHFLGLVRYVERNAKRAGLVARAEEWQWGSAWRRESGSAEQKKLLTDWPVPMPRNYPLFLNQSQTVAELDVIRKVINRGAPLGSDRWVEEAIKRFGLESTVLPRGRPRKGS